MVELIFLNLSHFRIFTAISFLIFLIFLYSVWGILDTGFHSKRSNIETNNYFPTFSYILGVNSGGPFI